MGAQFVNVLASHIEGRLTTWTNTGTKLGWSLGPTLQRRRSRGLFMPDPPWRRTWV